MRSRLLLDSNILVYAFDQADPAKQRKAVEVLRTAFDTGAGLLSVQVLGEFFSVATRKIFHPLTAAEAQEEVGKFLDSWPVVGITEMVLIEAVRGVKENGFSYWDAQLWATALLNQVPVILSEDFQDGLQAEGVRFTNPFSNKFEISTLV